MKQNYTTFFKNAMKNSQECFQYVFFLKRTLMFYRGLFLDIWAEKQQKLKEKENVVNQKYKKRELMYFI